MGFPSLGEGLGVGLLYHIHNSWQVVAKAVEPSTAGMRSHGVALIFALLLEEVVAAENLVAVIFQGAAVDVANLEIGTALHAWVEQ